MAVRIGELLLKEKLITPEQLQQALGQQKSNGGKLGAGGGAGKGGKPGDKAATGSTLEMASRGLEELQASLGGGDADGVEVLEELQEISAEALARQGEDAPVVRLVNVVLMSAIQKGASDIHIEPYEKELRVRYRIDGILYNIMAPPMKYRDAIVSRVKIMSKLDIAEKRLPQDGRIKIRYNEERRVGKECRSRWSPYH